MAGWRRCVCGIFVDGQHFGCLFKDKFGQDHDPYGFKDNFAQDDDPLGAHRFKDKFGQAHSFHQCPKCGKWH